VADARLAVGCVGPRPRRLLAVESLVRGRMVTDLVADAEHLATGAMESVEAVDDLHGSAEYKRHMTGVFVRRTLEIVIARAMGRESHARFPHTAVVTSAGASEGPVSSAPPGPEGGLDGTG